MRIAHAPAARAIQDADSRFSACGRPGRPDVSSVRCPSAALSLDTGIGAHWAAKELQPHICVQGNLDPMMLVAAASRWSARRPVSSTSSDTARSCSISATAWCRRRRPIMWRISWISCATGSPRCRDAVKIAIILFNLGGPDLLEAVQPFLRNLFGDPAILRAVLHPRPSGELPGAAAGADGGRSTTRSAALADPRPDRGSGARWKRRWAASMNGAATSACATGTR